MLRKSLTSKDFRMIALLGVGVVAVATGPRLARYVARKARWSAIFETAAEKLDNALGWDKLPPTFGLIILAGLRRKLRKKNLYDTSAVRSIAPPEPTPENQHYLIARTADGTFNDLSNPRMGAAGTRFGRNVPLEYTYPEPEPAILSPSPRTVSLDLLTRDTFVPATTLNVLAAAWLQFMIRDWF